MMNAQRPGPPVIMPYETGHPDMLPVSDVSNLSTVQRILKPFRDHEGHLDIDKITTVAQQVGQLYRQVSPVITKLAKR